MLSGTLSGRDVDTSRKTLGLVARRVGPSDVDERGGGDEAHGERARQVVVLATALVAQVQRVLLLPLVGVAEERHLPQEGVHDHVLVVDLQIGPE